MAKRKYRTRKSQWLCRNRNISIVGRKGHRHLYRLSVISLQYSYIAAAAKVHVSLKLPNLYRPFSPRNVPHKKHLVLIFNRYFRL